MDAEAQALSKEFFRITQQAEFNGQGLFDGSLAGGLRLQAGYGIDGSIQSTLANSLGTGSFVKTVKTPTQTSAASAAASKSAVLADLNSDGILDLVTGGYAWDGTDLKGQASVLLGRGDGTFADKRTFGTQISPGTCITNDVAVGDLNGDGILDLATAGYIDPGAWYQGQVAVFLGNGDGSVFGKRTISTETATVGSGASNAIAFADVNGDGNLDIVTAGEADEGQATVLLGKGDGSFFSKQTFATQVSAGFGAGSNDVAIGDVNGDGISDLVTVGYVHNGTRLQGEAAVLLGNGDGTFGNRSTYLTAHSTTGTSVSRSVALSDVNGDGVVDLVSCGTSHNGKVVGQIAVLLGKGDGTFAPRQTYAANEGTGSGESLELTASDVNGDGFQDLIASGQVVNGVMSGDMVVLLGRGDGTFNQRFSYAAETSAFGSARTEGHAIGDVNQDGIVDIVSAGDAWTGSRFQGEANTFLGLAREGMGPILPFSLATIADARQAMGLLDNKLNSLSSARGKIGAFQSRLHVAAATLGVARENLAAARSRINDADIAEESSTLLRSQILQQIGAAILGQANQQPALAVRLLNAG